MSALGQKQTCAAQKVMSALPPKADMCGATRDVRFVPIADIATCHDLKLHLGAYRLLRVCECLLARVFVTGAVRGPRTQHGLSDSRNRSIRHCTKFFLGSTD
mgnify:CR=1 FL=1